MSSTSDQLLKKFKIVATTVKKNLKSKGVAIPVKNTDGSVSLELYKIIKDSSGFYVIKNKRGDVVLDKINLPQSAALLANDLALGRWANNALYKLDQEYGYQMFERELIKKHAEKSLKNKNYDRAEILYTKLNILNSKISEGKKSIVGSFEKLRNIH